jgi:hypothetical protein
MSNVYVPEKRYIAAKRDMARIGLVLALCCALWAVFPAPGTSPAAAPPRRIGAASGGGSAWPEYLEGNGTVAAAPAWVRIGASRGTIRGSPGGNVGSFTVDSVNETLTYAEVLVGNLTKAESVRELSPGRKEGDPSVRVGAGELAAYRFRLDGDTLLTEIAVELNETADNLSVSIFDWGNHGGMVKPNNSLYAPFPLVNGVTNISAPHPHLEGGDDYFLVLNNTGQTAVEWLASNSTSPSTSTRIYNQTGGGYNWTKWENWTLDGDFGLSANLTLDPTHPIATGSAWITIEGASEANRSFNFTEDPDTFEAAFSDVTANGTGGVAVHVTYHDGEGLQFDAGYTLVAVDEGGEAEAGPIDGRMYRARINGTTEWNFSLDVSLNDSLGQNGFWVRSEPDWNVSSVSNASGSEIQVRTRRAGRGVAVELPENSAGELRISARDGPRLKRLEDERGSVGEEGLFLDLWLEGGLGNYCRGNFTFLVFDPADGGELYRKVVTDLSGGDHAIALEDAEFSFPGKGIYLAAALFENGTSADAVSLELEYEPEGEEEPEPEGEEEVRVWNEVLEDHPETTLELNGTLVNASGATVSPGSYSADISWYGGGARRSDLVLGGGETLHPIDNYTRIVEVVDQKGLPFAIRVLIYDLADGALLVDEATGPDGRARVTFSTISLGRSFEIRLRLLNGTAVDAFSLSTPLVNNSFDGGRPFSVSGDLGQYEDSTASEASPYEVDVDGSEWREGGGEEEEEDPDPGDGGGDGALGGDLAWFILAGSAVVLTSLAFAVAGVNPADWGRRVIQAIRKRREMSRLYSPDAVMDRMTLPDESEGG